MALDSEVPPRISAATSTSFFFNSLFDTCVCSNSSDATISVPEPSSSAIWRENMMISLVGTGLRDMFSFSMLNMAACPFMLSTWKPLEASRLDAVPSLLAESLPFTSLRSLL